MRFNTLAAWLAWQETLHPNAIDLGLERVADVARRLELLQPGCPVITIGGTNGKGSCVALLDSIYRAAGYRTGVYTSPHLLQYNERICIDGRMASDAEICTAFQRIDEARGTISLTYFEFGTLAALDLFHAAQLDVLLLEVGMGGRLDAVNIIAADVALITAIGIDHQRWLGDDRDTIAREKAGILRAGRPGICSDPHPPDSLLRSAADIGAELYCLGREFGASLAGDTWHWRGDGKSYADLPHPALTGRFQQDNAAAAVMAVELLQERLPVARESIVEGLRKVRLNGRFTLWPGAVETILDVAHNVQAAAALAENLRQRPCAGRTLAVVSLLADKDIVGILNSLREQVDAWHVAPLACERAASLDILLAALHEHSQPVQAADSIISAYRQARTAAQPGDRIVVFGSFYTVAEVLAERV